MSTQTTVLGGEAVSPAEQQPRADALKPCVDAEIGDFPQLHFEGTDAAGKDTVADMLVTSIVTCAGGGPLPFGFQSIEQLKGSGFFRHDSEEKLNLWEEKAAGKKLGSSLLLMATIDDMVRARAQSRYPAVQASHHSFRGASYEEAHGLPLRDEFRVVATELFPTDAFVPVALSATIDELTARIRENPKATPFDMAIMKQPDVVQAIIEDIEALCVGAGGVVVDTTGMCPDAVYSESLTRVQSTGRMPEPLSVEKAVDRGVEIIDGIFDSKTYGAGRTLASSAIRDLCEYAEHVPSGYTLT